MEVETYQSEALPQDPHEAAGELMNLVAETVTTVSSRYNKTVEIHKGRPVALETAFESLRAIEEHAAWATRMLVEIMGRYRKEHGRSRNTLSMRRVAEVSGVSLASVHSWVNYPAKVLDGGRRGPGTLPRPGQTSHAFTRGSSYFREDDGEAADIDDAS